jgi:hypothetical protein
LGRIRNGSIQRVIPRGSEGFDLGGSSVPIGVLDITGFPVEKGVYCEAMVETAYYRGRIE